MSDQHPPERKQPRLLDLVRQQTRLLHYSRSTEEAYAYWVRSYIRFHGLRHPMEMARAEIEAFLTWLATERDVAPGTHRQALSALLLLSGHDAIVAVYTTDAAVAALASTLLLYAAAFQFPDGIQVMSAGSLRGLRDTRVPMFLAMVSYWGLGMPLGAGLGLGLGWGPQGMWAGLIVGLTAAALLMGGRLAWRLRNLPPAVSAPPGGTLT